MSATPGMEQRRRATMSSTLCPGSWPPSPGLAPWAILIWSSRAFTRYWLVTPNRPEATCLMALFFELPPGSGSYRAGSSPPSPCLLYTSDAADDLLCVDLGCRRIIKKKISAQRPHRNAKRDRAEGLGMALLGNK